MARFFKYHTVEEIETDAALRGLDLRFSTDFSPLFRPVQVSGRDIGNSFCIQPMEGCDGTLDGKPDELTYRRFQRFGAGGAKLIWGEAAAVVPEGRANPRQLWICRANLPEFREVVRVCRSAHLAACGTDSDLLIGLQLTHSGRYSCARPIPACRDPILDRRTIVDRATGQTMDDAFPLITDTELEALVGAYVSAATLARDAGFDFVDIKQCHRYLLNELLSARTRPGPFGGSFENRTRLIREILDSIRRQVPDLILAARLNVFDSIPFQQNPSSGVGVPSPWTAPFLTAWGTNQENPLTPDLSEPLAWIGEMRALGVALVNVSMGNPYAAPHFLRPFETPPPDGYESPEHPLVGVDRHFRLTAEVQHRFPDLPIVGSGYSYLQEFLPHAGAANIRDGRVTLVGVGRASLSQPDFARQVQVHGGLDRKRICRTFSYCTALMRSKKNDLGQFATGCPPFDKEAYGLIWQEALRTRGK